MWSELKRPWKRENISGYDRLLVELDLYRQWWIFKLLLTKCIFSSWGIKAEELVPVPNVLESDIPRYLVRFPALDQIGAIISPSPIAVFVDGGIWTELIATTSQYHLSHSFDTSLLQERCKFYSTFKFLKSNCNTFYAFQPSLAKRVAHVKLNVTLYGCNGKRCPTQVQG